MEHSVVEFAQAMCREDIDAEEREFGQLEPSKNLDPLNPPLTIREYEAMERDRAKYLLYYAAIQQVVARIAAAIPPDQIVTLIVLGPGLGRLITYCLEAAQTHCSDRVFEIHALEANPRAVDFLQVRCRDMPHVVVHPPFTVHPAVPWETAPEHIQQLLGRGHLIVSELMGSFGDNEFMPEILLAARPLLAPTGVFVPRDLSVYVTPVHAPATHAAITRDGKGLAAGYVVGLGAEAVPGEGAGYGGTRLAYSWDVDDATFTGELRGAFTISAEDAATGEGTIVHGLAGHFTATLDGDLVIDTRITSPARNTFHWESFFLPLSSPTALAAGARIEVARRTQVAPVTGDVALWYEWSVTPPDGSAMQHNIDGETQCLMLSRPA